jgi:hypothetical protein
MYRSSSRRGDRRDRRPASSGHDHRPKLFWLICSPSASRNFSLFATGIATRLGGTGGGDGDAGRSPEHPTKSVKRIHHGTHVFAFIGFSKPLPSAIRPRWFNIISSGSSADEVIHSQMLLFDAERALGPGPRNHFWLYILQITCSIIRAIGRVDTANLMISISSERPMTGESHVADSCADERICGIVGGIF